LQLANGVVYNFFRQVKVTTCTIIKTQNKQHYTNTAVKSKNLKTLYNQRHKTSGINKEFPHLISCLISLIPSFIDKMWYYFYICWYCQTYKCQRTVPFPEQNLSLINQVRHTVYIQGGPKTGILCFVRL